MLCVNTAKYIRGKNDIFLEGGNRRSKENEETFKWILESQYYIIEFSGLKMKNSIRNDHNGHKL